MIGIYFIVAFALIAGGAGLGGVLIVSLGIRREEKAGSLTVASPGRAASGARATMSVHARRTGVSYQVREQQQEDLLALH